MNDFEKALLVLFGRLIVAIETHNQNIETLIEALTEEVDEEGDEGDE